MGSKSSLSWTVNNPKVSSDWARIIHWTWSGIQAVPSLSMTFRSPPIKTGVFFWFNCQSQYFFNFHGQIEARSGYKTYKQQVPLILLLLLWFADVIHAMKWNNKIGFLFFLFLLANTSAIFISFFPLVFVGQLTVVVCHSVACRLSRFVGTVTCQRRRRRRAKSASTWQNGYQVPTECL